MSCPEQALDSAKDSEIDAKLDHLVDTGVYSYDDARRKLGLPVDDPAKLARLMPRSDANDANGSGLESRTLRAYERNGWTRKAEQERQRLINKQGVALARQALQRAMARRSR